MLGLVVATLASFAPGAGADGAEWNITRVKAPRSASGIIVAVVDTGVDAGHVAFQGRMLPQWDCLDVERGCQQRATGDPHGHGTHVAGTAAGGTIICGDGPARAIGVAPDVTILPIRGLGADGSGSTAGIANGIRKAVELGASVINLSLAGEFQSITGESRTLRNAIDEAWAAGAIPVVAAGNGAVFGLSLNSPYSDINAVVVTATDNRDRASSYADGVGGAKWGMAAPGGDGSGEGRSILSAVPGACGFMNGTSMATPHVTGALAVLRARGLNQQQAVDRVLKTARDLGPSGVDSTYGHGLLDLGAALAGLGGGGGGPTTTAPAATTPTTRQAPAGTTDTTAASAPATTSGASAAPAPSTSPVATDDNAATVDGEASTDQAVDAEVTTTAPATADGDEVAIDTGEAGRPDAGGNGPGAALAVLAVVSCGAAWAFAGRAALTLRR